MPINHEYDEDKMVSEIANALDKFYVRLIAKINKLDIKTIMKKKNPYLFRAKAMSNASQIVEAILSAFISSSEETIFGNVFFEPVAKAAANGNKALASGIDIMIERPDVIYAIAVKSGVSVFNADSRTRQEQNFAAASKLAQQAHKRFVPIIGYCYGQKKQSNRGLPKIYQELAGKEFWAELTGDENFYIKLIKMMGSLPEKYVEELKHAHDRAANRLVKEFTTDFCLEDGSIDWQKLIIFNSGDSLEIK